jgi:membrane protein insertase Oxa1/YidC/SpoIIIJ
MKIFPIFFGFISFQMPAGLVVYFAASQIFRIGQQGLIIGLDARKEAAAPAKEKPAKADETEPSDEKAGERPSDGAAAPSRDRRPPESTRSPQASKKRRGKKRRRK